jgi:glutamyl-tRNA reductase
VPIVHREAVKRALADRKQRPLLILDIAVPRDVEPAVRDLPNVFLYDIDALEGLIQKNLERRRREIPKVEAIIAQETEQFLRWYGSLEATPVIRELRERFEAIRAREVDRHASKFCEQDRDQIVALTRALINKLLHEPTVSIRGFQQDGAGRLSRIETVRKLFGLGEPERDESDADA